MPDDERKSDYLQGIKDALKGLQKKVKKIINRHIWEDENGKKHFSRKAKPKPTPIPPPPTPTPTPTPTPDEGKTFGRIKHDYELYGKSRPERIDEDRIANGLEPLNAKGYPETVKAVDSEWVKFYKEWQWFSFDILWLANPQLKREDVVNLFRKIYRYNAFKTNKQLGFNYITRDGNPDEILKTEVIFTGGAYIEILDYPTVYTRMNIPCYKVRTLSVLDTVPSANDFDGKYQTPFIYFATTSNRDNNGTLVIPLTGVEGITIKNIPIANLSNHGYCFVEAARIEILQPKSPVPNPYNPPR